MNENQWNSFLTKIFRSLALDGRYSPAELASIKKRIRSVQDLNDFLTGLMAAHQPPVHEQQHLVPMTVIGGPTVRCEGCGLDMHAAFRSGHFGCPICYEFYARTVVPAFGMAAGMGGMNNQLEPPPKTKKTRADKIESLEKRMAKAIKDERYEDAAKYRDRLKELKGSD